MSTGAVPVTIVPWVTGRQEGANPIKTETAKFVSW